MAITQIKGSNIEDGTVVAADIKADSITNAQIKSDAAIDASKLGSIPASKLEGTLDLSGKTVTLPAAAVTAHAVTPTLDSPVITGTLSVLDSGTVTHTVANWSDDLSYTIVPTNCTAGAVNASGQYVITHTSGTPSYTIKATTASLGLGDSALVTKNITLQLTAPTLSSPADVGTVTNVVYTITSTSTGDDILILDIGSANFTYQSVSVGTASKVGNTVECIGFTTNNPAVTIQYTAEATYSVTATSVKIDGSYGTSANSSADSITIANFTGMVATGGDQSPSSGVVDGNYKYHTFTTTGSASFQITTLGSVGTVEWLVIAGGGGGGGGLYSGAGGGAGGYRTATGLAVTAVTYTAVVGAGGAGGASSNVGTDGTNSSFSGGSISTITATGGGGGGYSTGGSGRTGGSGGGEAQTSGFGTGNAGGYDPVEGYAGGGGTSSGPYQGSGGGGGAGAVGVTGTNTAGGNGGVGRTSSITGSPVPRGGGGGGVAYSSGVQGAGGTGGGGAATNTNGVNGTVNTGGGGGGAERTGGSTGGTGGSGIIVIRYQFQ